MYIQGSTFRGTDGYRVLVKQKFLGTGQQFFFWVPGTGQKKNFGYRLVVGTGHIFNDADPWNIQMIGNRFLLMKVFDEKMSFIPLSKIEKRKKRH